MNNHVWFDTIGWAGAVALLIAYALISFKRLERRLDHVSVPQYRRQRSIGREHDLLRLVSVHICKSHLGRDSCFFHCHEKASRFSLGKLTITSESVMCAK